MCVGGMVLRRSPTTLHLEGAEVCWFCVYPCIFVYLVCALSSVHACVFCGHPCKVKSEHVFCACAPGSSLSIFQF